MFQDWIDTLLHLRLESLVYNATSYSTLVKISIGRVFNISFHDRSCNGLGLVNLVTFVASNFLCSGDFETSCPQTFKSKGTPINGC